MDQILSNTLPWNVGQLIKVNVSAKLGESDLLPSCPILFTLVLTVPPFSQTPLLHSQTDFIWPIILLKPLNHLFNCNDD